MKCEATSLKCMQGWYILGAGKGVLFREVRGVLIERDSTDMYILESLTQV